MNGRRPAQNKAAFACAVLLSGLWSGVLFAQTASGPPSACTLQDGGRRSPAVAVDAKRLGRVESPSTRLRTYTGQNLFRVRVPSNWCEVIDRDAVVFAPPGGYGEPAGQAVFTHGVEIGLAPRDGDDLKVATDALINLLADDNPSLRRVGDVRFSLAHRPAVRVVLSNVSDVTGRQERMEIVTTLLRDGRLFYALVVAPHDQFDAYRPTFRRLVSSIAIIE